MNEVPRPTERRRELRSGWRREGCVPRLQTAFLAAVLLVGAVSAAADIPASAAERGRQHPESAQPPDPYFPDLGNRGDDVQHYDIGLAYDPASKKLTGDTTITANATERLRRFNLDLAGLDVSSIDVDDAPARFRRNGDELIVRPRRPIAPAAPFTVRVRYSGRPEPGEIPGIHAPNGWISTDDGALTLNEPDGARRWFPANDHPTDKATFTFRLDVPRPLAAIANGDLQSRTDHGARTTFVWDQTAPMATYLTQLVIGDITVQDAPPVEGVVIRHAFGKDIRGDAEPAAAATPDMLTFLSSWFGPFPFSTYGVLAPDGGMSGLAFEAQTFSVFSPDVFSTPGGASPVLAHEMAHQWFGDWVSPASWKETWLNEGFATYAEWLWSDRALGHPLQQSAQNAVELANAEPDAAAKDPGRSEMFGSAVYQRGALTLHALRLTVGDDAFVRILRTYLDRFGGKTASTADFVGVASEVAGHDLTSFLGTWLGPGAVPPLPHGGAAGSTAPPI